MPNISDRELNRLKGSVSELSVLNKIANAINVTMSVERISRIIVENCLERIGATQGGIYLLETREKGSRQFETFVRKMDAAGEIPFHVRQGLKGWIIKHKQILLSNAPDQDDRFPGMDFTSLGIRSLLAAPLLSRNGLIGVLAVVNKNSPDGFGEQDRRFLGIVATQTAHVIENARLFEADKRRVAMEEEMRLAHWVQKSLLPPPSLKMPGCEIFGFNQPAKDMGGDYYDMFRIDDDRVFFSLGDVAGKGMPAAMLMGYAQAALRSQVIRKGDISLPQLAESLNLLIWRLTPPEHHQEQFKSYITAIFGVYDTSRQALSYINAGHMPPLVVTSDGRLSSLSDADLVIGVLPDFAYSPSEVRLEKHDTVFLYTDGVTEAFNENEESFGEPLLHQVIIDNYKLDIAALGEKVNSEVGRHRGKREPSDDITMLILRTT
jgi:sigma-B regulation protein RsbU (phosphoserine phosphatase)